MHRATREIRDIQKEIEKSRHAMELALKAATAVAVAERVAVLKAAFASLTDSTSVSYVGCKTSKGYTTLVTISCKNFNGHNNSIAFEVEMEVTATGSLLEIEDLVKDLEVQLRKKMEELYALKGELNNIASTERQARAALAEATLRGTAQGRELLEAMTQMAGLMEVPQIGMTLNDEVK
jgi:hypothetical protein